MQAELEVKGNEGENYVISIRMNSTYRPAHTPCVFDTESIHQELILSRSSVQSGSNARLSVELF